MTEFEEHMAEISRHLAIVWDEGIPSAWTDNKELFIENHMDLVRACYIAGYLDATDRVTEAVDNIARNLDTTDNE